MTIVAPPGYGKTQVLAHVHRLRGAQTVTVRADASMTANDLLGRIAEGTGSTPMRRRRDLTSALQALGRRDVTLMVDNCEALADQHALRVLEDLLLDDPLERTVVLSGRALPDLDWSRVALVRRRVPVTSQQLRLRLDDVVPGDRPPRLTTLVTRIVGATDGWHAAIAIAALHAPHPAWARADDVASAHASAPVSAPRDISAADAEAAWQQVRSYVQREVVSRVPQDLLTSLRHAALTADVTQVDLRGGRAPALPMLRWQGRDLVEMAPLLRDLLIGEARRVDEDQAHEVARAALARHRQRGDHHRALDLAVRHRWTDEVTVDLLDHGAELFFRGHVALLATAMEALPAETLKGDSGLLTLRAMLATVEDSLGATLHWLDLADAMRPSETPKWAPGGIGPSTLLRMVIGLMTFDEAFGPVPIGADVPMPWFGLHSVLFGFDALCRGDFVRSLGILSAVEQITAAQPAVELNRLSIIAAAASFAGEDATRDAALENAEALQGRLGDASLRGVMLRALTTERLLREGQRAEALALLESTLAMASLTSIWFRTPRILAFSRLVLVARRLGREDLVRSVKIAARPLIEHAQVTGRFIDPRITAPLLHRAADPHVGAAPAETVLDPRASPRLSPAEVRILDALAGPKPVPRLAEELAVSTPTVRTHVRAIYAKLGVANRADAVDRGRALKLIP